MSLPPLNALRAFEAAARLGSFSAAAETLFVTQSAVSHQIRHLEQWLGAPLFDRRGGRPKLLPHAAALARDLGLALSGIDAACRTARHRARDDDLVIAAIPSVAVCWLIPRLPGFRDAHPEITLRVIYAHHGQSIDFDDVDFAFIYTDRPPGDPGLRADPFLPGASAPVCGPQVLERLGDAPPGPSAILRAGLLHDASESGWRRWLRKAGHDLPAGPTGPVFEDFNLLRAAALSGQGVALCPLAMIRPDLEAGHLVQLSSATVHDDFAYFLVSQAVSGTETAVENDRRGAFRDWARAARAELAAA